MNTTTKPNISPERVRAILCPEQVQEYTAPAVMPQIRFRNPPLPGGRATQYCGKKPRHKPEPCLSVSVSRACDAFWRRRGLPTSPGARDYVRPDAITYAIEHDILTRNNNV